MFPARRGSVNSRGRGIRLSGTTARATQPAEKACAFLPKKQVVQEADVRDNLDYAQPGVASPRSRPFLPSGTETAVRRGRHAEDPANQRPATVAGRKDGGLR